MSVKRQRLVFLVNYVPFFISHRMAIALAARDAGYDVHVIAAESPRMHELEAEGLACHPISLSRSGLNPLQEVRTFLAICRLLRKLQPDIVHMITSKPVIYGGIAARLVGVRGVVAAITGMGHVFVSPRRTMKCASRLVTLAYRFSLKGVKTIVQNPSDAGRFIDSGMVRPEALVTIRGSGVDLAEYAPQPEPAGIPVVVFAARLLHTKGIREYLSAAEQLRHEGVKARFVVVGERDPENAASITEAELAYWKKSDGVEMVGFQTDMPQVLAAANLVVLPSYGEGLPKVLIEAAASGRAVVTTDVPGCRDAIEADVTGLLVPPQDAAALAAAIRELLHDPARRREMGEAGRRLAAKEFSIQKVVARHLEIYRAVAPDRPVESGRRA